MDIDQGNLINLTRLWRKYGVQDLSLAGESGLIELSANPQWPYRVWREQSIANTAINTAGELLSWLKLIPESHLENATVPVWPFYLESSDSHNQVSELARRLEAHGWQCAFSQTAMYLPLQALDTERLTTRESFSLEQVHESQQLKTWVSIASEAFGYRIHQPVFEGLLVDPNIQILLGVFDGEPVATALLYQTENVIGLHQMGVGKAFQGRGFAKSMMHELLLSSVRARADSIVLQASQAGKPLYDSLGFKTQFTIRNYKSG